MTTKLPIKGTGESIVIGFNFSREADAVTLPTFTVACEPGLSQDTAPMGILSGSPQIDSSNAARVLQRVVAGLDGVDYRIQCTVQAGSDVLTLGAILPVRANV